VKNEYNMQVFHLALITTATMLAFAANSILCRIALTETDIDAASFTTFRLVSGALTIFAIVLLRSHSAIVKGNWLSAFALFAYAAGFSFAYLSLSAATGALLLFGAVQATMISYGLARGERPNSKQYTGIVMAIAGLLYLLLPGAQAPSATGALLMVGAGIAWGIYSLRGRGVTDPTIETAGNFIRSIPFALIISLLCYSNINIDISGVMYAVASGAIASGLGYATWYLVLPQLAATTAATVQLSVPAIAALGGIALLSEPLNFRVVVASILILGGVAIFVWSKRSPVS
jgi:drug/metabolite transporter (DMT)-like permease